MKRLLIDLHYQSDPPFDPHTHEKRGIGGTENFVTYAAEYLARAGHKVRVYNRLTEPKEHLYPKAYSSTYWMPMGHFKPEDPRDVLISFRFRDVFQTPPNARLKVLMLADTESVGLGEDIGAGRIDMAGFVSNWQREKIAREEAIPPEACYTTSNGINMELWDADRPRYDRVPGKCIHIATPERGLTYLMDIWPEVQKRIPRASLHLFSSFRGWGVSEEDNEAMAAQAYQEIATLQAQGANVINHKHAGAAEIRRHMLESEAYLYPTRHFDETCCISAIEAAAAGVPIVATARAALNERVVQARTGYLVQDVDGHNNLFTAMIIRTLLNPGFWHLLSNNAVKYARGYHYETIIGEWIQEFNARLEA